MNTILRLMRFSGLTASVVFWIFTLISISFNSWFDFYRDAFSDLGGSRAFYPWIYNTGLVISSIFIEAFSIHMIIVSRDKLGVVAGSYMSVAGIFLSLIAVFPAGTRPHVFVSTWFFIQAFIGALLYGLARVREDKIFSTTIFIIFILAVVGALIKWPSAATLEAYEIILLTIFSILYILRVR